MSQSEPILLDFHPFYIPPKDIISQCIYWYDLIDNFTLHNLYSRSDIAKVVRKYEFVREHAALVTGVSSAAVEPFNGTVFANRLLRSSVVHLPSEPEYDLGFLGFITDKFDVEFIRRIAHAGVKVLICGHAYSRATLRELCAIRNVSYEGPFRLQDVPRLISRFRIGIVPYLKSRLHDESPIKFFQYVAHGRPVLLSTRFNAEEDRFRDFVHYYDSDDLAGTLRFIHRTQLSFERMSRDVLDLAQRSLHLYWEDSIGDILDLLPTRPALRRNLPT